MNKEHLKNIAAFVLLAFLFIVLLLSVSYIFTPDTSIKTEDPKAVITSKNRQILHLLNENEELKNNWKACEGILRQTQKEIENAKNKQ